MFGFIAMIAPESAPFGAARRTPAASAAWAASCTGFEIVRRSW